MLPIDSLSPESSYTQAQWRPVIFDRSREGDVQQMDCLLDSRVLWQVYDTIELQLRDLLETRLHTQCPRTEDETTRAIHEITQEVSPYDFGRWIFYPWSGILAHLLPPDEFHELRLDRNRLKVTAAEQQRLAQTSVGIVGLSVGNAIANTVALEGACGHLKLADFDRLDLSNMNRIRAAVHDINLPKTVLVARQIYELNPYVSLSIYPEGLTPDTVDDFLRENPPIQALVDECDDIRMKILLRERARALGVPVLMETSDRGMLDVERFDQEPDRPILHGLLGTVTSEEIPQKLSNEEKVRYVLPVIGTATLSTRIGASLLEIEKTVSTWPQLGADVVLGGASMTVALRRLALGQPLPSGRRFIDLDALVRDEKVSPAVQPARPAPTALSTPNSSFVDERIPMNIRFLVERAALAPSGGNCQPWRFSFDADQLWIMHDRQRSQSTLDIDYRASYLAVGAAMENLDIAAAALGYRAQITPFPHPGHSDTVASVNLLRDDAVSSREVYDLSEQIQRRATIRTIVPRSPIDSKDATALASACRPWGCHLALLEGEPELAEIGDIMGKADRIRFTCRQLHQECMEEIRWTEDEVTQRRDGVDLETLGLTPKQRAGMVVVARPDVAAFLREIGGGTALETSARDAARASGAVAVLSVEGAGPADMIRAGRGFQHLWLMAGTLNLAIHPWTAAIYMFELARTERASIFTEGERTELAELEQRFARLYPLPLGHLPAMLFRLFYADPPQRRSLRLPLEQVLSYGAPHHPGGDSHPSFGAV